MEGLGSFERANLYVALHIYFRWIAEGGGEPPIEVINFYESLGVQLPTEVPDDVAEYVRHFRAGSCRTDLNPAARSNLQNHLTAFYNSAGYVSTEPADSLLAITAFAARLAIDAYTAQMSGAWNVKDLERRLHRFVNTHLLPTLRVVRPPREEFCRAIDGLTRLLSEDVRTLASKFTRVASR